MFLCHRCYRMTLRNTLLSEGSILLRSVLLAFMLLIVGTNAADAAECGPEVTGVELVQISDADETPDQQPAPDDQQKHSVCPHGHCHNGNLAVADNDSSEQTLGVMRSRHHSHSEEYALSAHISRLKRPPRA